MSMNNQNKKTIYVSIKKLENEGLITKNNDGKYVLTKEGRRYIKNLAIVYWALDGYEASYIEVIALP